MTSEGPEMACWMDEGKEKRKWMRVYIRVGDVEELVRLARRNVNRPDLSVAQQTNELVRGGDVLHVVEGALTWEDKVGQELEGEHVEDEPAAVLTLKGG